MVLDLCIFLSWFRLSFYRRNCFYGFMDCGILGILVGNNSLMDLFLSIFSLHKMLIDKLEWCGLRNKLVYMLVAWGWVNFYFRWTIPLKTAKNNCKAWFSQKVVSLGLYKPAICVQYFTYSGTGVFLKTVLFNVVSAGGVCALLNTVLNSYVYKLN